MQPARCRGDPEFIGRVHDVVGCYLSPPEYALGSPYDSWLVGVAR
jgi:hypothetical protein